MGGGLSPESRHWIQLFTDVMGKQRTWSKCLSLLYIGDLEEAMGPGFNMVQPQPFSPSLLDILHLTFYMLDLTEIP